MMKQKLISIGWLASASLFVLISFQNCGDAKQFGGTQTGETSSSSVAPVSQTPIPLQPILLPAPVSTPVVAATPTPIPPPPSCVATLDLPDGDRQNTASKNANSQNECTDFCQEQVSYTNHAFSIDCSYQGNFIQTYKL